MPLGGSGGAAGAGEAGKGETAGAGSSPSAGTAGSVGGNVGNGGTSDGVGGIGGIGGASNSAGNSQSGEGGGGTSAGSNAAGSAGETDCGDAGAAGQAAVEKACTGNACKEPTRIRVHGNNGTRFGGNGGNLTFDMCLEDEAIIAVRWETGVRTGRGTDSRVVHVQVDCGQLVLDNSGKYTVKSVHTRTLLKRGRVDLSDPAELKPKEAACPENHILVGMKGLYGTLSGTPVPGQYGYAVKELSFSCAPLNVTSDSEGHELSPGEPTEFAEFDAVTGEALPGEAICAAGEVARGLQLRAGRWVDAIGIVCGAPKLTYPLGAPCSDAFACASGLCDTTCQPKVACDAPCGCTCLTYEFGQYAFCERPVTAGEASTRCMSKAMHPVHPSTLAESGWLRTAASSVGIMGQFWVGVSSVSQGPWRYSDGTDVPLHLQFAQGDTFWRESMPSNTADKGCVQTAIEGSWVDVPCTAFDRYVCEK